MAAPLPFPHDERPAWPDRWSLGYPRSASLVPLAVIVSMFLIFALISGAFVAGRKVEQRSQLGYLIAAAPALEQLTAATRSMDSLSMEMMLRMGRVKARRVSAPAHSQQ